MLEMPMRILCTTDLSSRSDRALRRAARLAREAGADLVVLAVVDDDQPRSLIEAEHRAITALLGEVVPGMAEMQGLSPRLRVEVGDPFDAIIRVADEEAADLVVMGEHRKRLLRDIVIGTTIERVMRLGGRPVLMVNRPAELPYRRVLAAIDMSDTASDALRTAARLGLAREGEVTLFHAFEQPGRANMALANLPAEKIAGHAEATASRTRAALDAYLAGRDLGLGPVPPPIVIEEGVPAEALRDVADRLSSDLVVLGTRGHGAVGRLLLGSVAEQALRSLTCDVLAVPPRAG